MREKRSAVIEKAHTRPTFCLLCEIQLLPADLEAHRARCPGRREPDSLDNWETEAQAKQRGASVVTLRRLANSGKVRSRMVDGTAQYLVRDVEQVVIAREAFGVSVGEVQAKPLSAVQERIIEAVRARGRVNLNTIAGDIHRSFEVTKRETLKLVRLGQLVRSYPRGGTRKGVFRVGSCRKNKVGETAETSAGVLELVNNERSENVE